MADANGRREQERGILGLEGVIEGRRFSAQRNCARHEDLLHRMPPIDVALQGVLPLKELGALKIVRMETEVCEISAKAPPNHTR